MVTVGSGPAGSRPGGSGPGGSGPAGSGPAGSGPAGSGPAQINGKWLSGSDGPLWENPSAHEHQPLRHQEDGGPEHAGRGSTDGQLVPAEDRPVRGSTVPLLHPPGGSAVSVHHAAGHRGAAAHLHRQVRSERREETRQVEQNEQCGDGLRLLHGPHQHLHNSSWVRGTSCPIISITGHLHI